jgi:hypothetical protein
MAADHFFNRWARHKVGVPELGAPTPASVVPAASQQPSQPYLAQPASAPTLSEVPGLTPDSDYSRFFAAGVDKTVQRAALKKLFADPHFNLIDGLDIFMGDYNIASPMPAAMLAALSHVQSMLEPTAPEPAEQRLQQDAVPQEAVPLTAAPRPEHIDLLPGDTPEQRKEMP